MKHKLISSFLAVLLLTVMAFAPVQLAFAVPPSISITSPTPSQIVGSGFTISGTATADILIEVAINGSSVGATTADGAGNWTINVTGQSDGTKNITATAMNNPLVYIGSLSTTNVRVFDSSNDTQVVGSPFALGAGFGYTVISPDNSFIYSTSAIAGADLSVLDTSTNTSVTYNFAGTILGGLDVSSDGSLLYISDSSDNSIEVISTSDFSLVDQIDVGTTSNYVSLNAASSAIYVASASSDNVIVVDLNDSSTSTISLGTGSNPSTLLNNNGDDLMYASVTGSPGYVVVIDTLSNTVIDTITVGYSPTDMAILSDDSELYVTNSQDIPGTVSIIDTTSNTIVQNVEVGLLPYGIDITPDDSKIYVTCLGNIFDSGQEGGVWMISSGIGTEIFETDDGSISPTSIGEFIVGETTIDTVGITVSADTDENEALADTGINQIVVFFTSAFLILGAGFVLRRYNSYV